MKDLLYPINEKNRNENIIVEYDGFIKSLTERLYLMTEIEYDGKEDMYPLFKELKELDYEDRFSLINLYSTKGFNEAFFNGKLEEDFINRSLSNGAILEFQSNLLFDYSLFMIMQEKFARSLSIVKSTPWLDEEKILILNTFEDLEKRISLYEGDIVDVVKDLNNFTTIGINSFESIKRIVDFEDFNKKTAFILRNNLSNVSILENGSIKLLYTDEIMDLYENQSIIITRMFSNCMIEKFNTEEESVG